MEFRKSLALAALALAAFGVSSASAQCVGSTGSVPNLRSEGKTELVGSVVLTCSGLVPGSSANFTVNLLSPSANGSSPSNVPDTSRVGESTLVINGAAYTGVVTTSAGIGGGTVTSVQYNGVNIPSTNPTIVIQGVRGDMTGVPVFAAGFGEVTEFISVSNAIIPIANNNFLVGVVLPGLAAPSTTPGPSINLQSCTGTITLNPTQVLFTVNIPENFPTAFKVQGTLFAEGDNETGTSAVQASTGTEFAVTFANVPSGLTYYIPLTITSTAGGTAVLVTAQGAPVVLATATSGAPAGTEAVTSGTYYYEVTSSFPSVQETFQVPVIAGGTINGTTGSAATASVALAPSYVSGSGWAPMFVSDNYGPQGIPGLSVAPCTTALLFPFMTNQASFDTGFSIGATSADPFGTTPIGGVCTLNFYGMNAPTAPANCSTNAAQPGCLTVAAGATGQNLVSLAAPNFEGYMIAVCNFPYAHGYAFLSNNLMGGNDSLSEGYVANVIGNSRNNASSWVNGTGNPESLGH